jgi:hypothetical protein
MLAVILAGCGDGQMCPASLLTHLFEVRLQIDAPAFPADLEVTVEAGQTTQTLALTDFDEDTLPCSLETQSQVLCRWGNHEDDVLVEGRFVATASGHVTVDEDLHWEADDDECAKTSIYAFELAPD